MSKHDYDVSRDIQRTEGVTFYGIIMAAMRRADGVNLAALKKAFPDTWDELHTRYNAPGGMLHAELVVEVERLENDFEHVREIALASVGQDDRAENLAERERVGKLLRNARAALELSRRQQRSALASHPGEP